MWLWMLQGSTDRMHRHATSVLERAARDGLLHVSDISCWEVARKAADGRLALGLPIDEWLALAERAPGVTMVPLQRQALVLGARLDDMHGDPVDRWLVATAKLGQYTLLTADAVMLEFGRRERLTKMGDVRR